MSCLLPKAPLPRWSALAGALACLALPSGASAQAPAPPSPLPTSVRLQLRVKPSDAWEEKYSDHFYFDLNISALNRNDEAKYYMETTLTGVDQNRVRSVSSTGVIEQEQTDINTKAVTDIDGTKQTKILNQRRITTLNSDNRITKAIIQDLVIPAAKGAAPKPTGVPRVKPEHDMELNIPFPDKPVSVGDTWEGAVSLLPQGLSDESMVNYQAKLTKIDVHNGVPCACVQYTFDKQKISPPKALIKILPDGTSVTGTMKVDGNVRQYYSLDRGIRVEVLGSLIVSIEFLLERPATQGFKELNTTLGGSYQIDIDHTSRKLPPYDPSLLTSDSRA